jgi:hypothetical protein
MSITRSLQVLAAAVTVATTSACAAPAADEELNAPVQAKVQHDVKLDSVTVLLKSEGSGYRTVTRQIIKDSIAYGEAWLKAGGPRAKQPAVDFSSDEVVVVGLGTKGTTGYDVRILGVRVDSAGTTIHLEEIVPADMCDVGMMVTQPVVIGRYRKRLDQRAGLPENFVVDRKTPRC